MSFLRTTDLRPWLRPALLSAIPVILLALLIGHQLTGVVETRAVAVAERDAKVFSRVTLEPNLSPGELRHGLSSPRRKALDHAVGRPARARGIAGATVWGGDLQSRYSYGPATQLDAERTSGVRSALAGRTGSVMTSRSEGEVLEVYVPLRVGNERHPGGAFEVDKPYGPIAAAVARDSRKLQLLLAAALAIAYVALLGVALIASREHGRRAEEKDKEANQDPLTGLPNRAVFQQLLERAILAGRRKRTLMAVMVMDLDRFKEINDTLGHFNGDQLLQRLAARLRAVMRDADTIARLGGDEFAILMPDMPNQEAVRSAAERILQAFEEPFVVGGIALQVQGSIGVALYPEHGKRGDAVLHAADVAMYVAKAQHSGFEFHSSDQNQNSPDRLAMVAELRRGIEQGQLLLHYQPKAELSTRRVTGVEALIRWEHPTRGLLYPDEFISLAEQTGLIRPLTHYVLETALRQGRAWRDDGLELDVAVNLSVHNLMDLDFADDLARLLAESKLPPSSLELEITESMIMSEPRRAMSVLGRLRSMGVKLAVDDFGTGYSSLAYLKQLPVSTIKIDKSFVIPMVENEDDAAIVRSTIDLGRNLGLEVVAEGVESEEAWCRLAENGCDLAQGYHLSKPVAPADLTGWLSAYIDLVPGPAPNGVKAR
jgi:diguanylate cyclase (GGDEF)-like protein